jgi:hypothetical protein
VGALIVQHKKRPASLLAFKKWRGQKLGFAGCSQAARANFDPASLAILKDSDRLYVGFPLPLGMTQRVAHFVTTHCFFLTDFTFGHDSSSF